MEPDTKRYYPYSSLASHVIGFVGMDNTGLAGIEYAYDETLTGVNGSILRLKNSAGTDMLFNGYEEYVAARDGCSIYLTLDTTLQYFLEKSLRQAVEDYDVQNGAAGILMDPQTGAILAMASLGDFDLNDYQTVAPEIQAQIDACSTPEEAAAMLAAASSASGATRPFRIPMNRAPPLRLSPWPLPWRRGWRIWTAPSPAEAA